MNIIISVPAPLRTPGQKAEPSDQGEIPVCSAHAVAKAIVELLDADDYDSDQKMITWILINHRQMDFKEAFPDVFDKLKIALEIVKKNKANANASQLCLGEVEL